jgi:hypothetical protein
MIINPFKEYSAVIDAAQTRIGRTAKLQILWAKYLTRTPSCAQVWKCIQVHMPDEMEEQSSIVGTVSSRFELLFFAKFEVRRRPNGSFELSAVYLAPFPPRSQVSAGGDCLWLVPDLDVRLLALEDVKKDERTLAAVLPPQPLEGFTVAVRQVQGPSLERR